MSLNIYLENTMRTPDFGSRCIWEKGHLVVDTFLEQHKRHVLKHHDYHPHLTSTRQRSASRPLARAVLRT